MRDLRFCHAEQHFRVSLPTVITTSEASTAGGEHLGALVGQALIATGYTVTRYDEHDTVFRGAVVLDPDLATGSGGAP